ncbi:MAG TPA: YcaO-related McrA-glycine thioamidation protein [Candidatus Methanoperedenaceae archaeon]|nr:YcaO-related McrA-glycine thioamidation protein [Candidatus Methanoperedenaceae archaeon]
MKLTLDPGLKYFPGTQRVFDPETSLARTKDMLPEIGVTRIASITDLDRVGIPVFSAVRPSAARGAISIYSGKGASETVARISAIMESFERCLAEQPEVSMNLKGVDIACERRTGTYEKSRDDSLNPNELLLPMPLLAGTVLEWVGGWDLLREEDVFVPANAVFHPYVPAGGMPLFRSNTNGLAAGNTMEEAVLHGLLEVIERDALGIAESTKNPGRELIVNDGVNRELMKKFDDAGVAVKLWLLDSDIDIPTVVAALDDPVLRDPALLVMGAGSHLKPEIAASRALTEAAQSRVVQIHGAREDTNRESIVRTIGYERLRRMNGYWYGTGDSIRIDQLEDSSSDSPARNIETVLERLGDPAERAIIVDLSRKGVKVPVIRAIIPTFELFTIDRERRGARLAKAKNRAVAR